MVALLTSPDALNGKIEVIPPDSMVGVTSKSNPFAQKHKRIEVPQGLTVWGLIDLAVPSYWPRENLRVEIDGVEVPFQFWKMTKPKPGREVTVYATPMGGGNGNQSGAIFSAIVVFVAVIMAVFTWGGSLAALGVVGAGGLAYADYQFVYRPMVAGLGGLADLSGKKDDSPSLYIRGARNDARQFDPIPRMYGKHRIVPPYAAEPYTELVGDDVYVRLLFCPGYGPLEMTDFRIGDTPLSNFTDVETEVRNGFPHDPPITLYPNSAFTTSLSINLSEEWQSQTSVDDIDEAVLEFEFPKGLFITDDSKDGRDDRRVKIQIQYRQVGGSDWSDITYASWEKHRVMPFARGISIKLPARAQYQFQVRRENAEGGEDGKVSDTCVWSAIRGLRNADPVVIDKVFPGRKDSAGRFVKNYTNGLALVALRIKATDQLNNIVDTFNFIARAIVLDLGSYALDFNGTDQYLSLSDYTAASGAHSRTIECWAFLRAAAGGSTKAGLFEAGPVDGANEFSVYFDYTTNKWNLKCASGTYAVPTTTPESVGQWCHYAVTYDGNYVRFYINGVQKHSVTMGALNTTKKPVVAGRWGSAFWNGKIREFRVWSIAVPVDLIASRMETPILSDIGGLAGYWRMSEGSGVSVYDYGIACEHYTLDKSTSPTWTTGGGGPAEIWEPRPTQNPASAFRDIAEGSANKRPIKTVRVNLDDLEDWHKRNRTESKSLKFKTIAPTGAGVNGVDMTNVSDYVIQAGDCLEYDVFWSGRNKTANIQTVFDLWRSDGAKFRSGGAVDTGGFGVGSMVDLTGVALGQWYARKCALTPTFSVGETITKYVMVCDCDVSGTHIAYFRNVRITDGKGTVRKWIWKTGDADPTLANVETTSAEYRASGTAAINYEIGRARDFNFVFDYVSSAKEAMEVAANAGRATSTIRDGFYTIIEDRPQTVPVQYFNPRNSKDFKGTQTFVDRPHALKVRFVDEDDNYQQKEIVVYDDGYNATTATKFEGRDIKAVTKKEQAIRLARYYMAAARLRPEIFELTTDFEHLVCVRGSYVKVNHDVIGAGLGFGRISSVTRNGSNNVTALGLDAAVIMEAGKAYVVRIRTVDGGAFLANVNTVAGEQFSLTLSTPVDSTVAKDDLFMFGERGIDTIDCVVASIDPQDDLSARLTLAPAAFDLELAEDGFDVGDYDVKMTFPPDVMRAACPPIIKRVLSDETTIVRLPGGGFQCAISVYFGFKTIPGYATPAFVQAAYRVSDSDSEYISLPYQRINNMSITIPNVSQGKRYDIRLRMISEAGITSDWVSALGHVVIGLSTPPPDPVSLAVRNSMTGTKKFTWKLPSKLPADVAGVKIRYGSDVSTWATMTPLHTGVITSGPYETKRPTNAGSYRFGIKTVDYAGNESVNAVYCDASVIGATRTIIYQGDERENNWPGNKSMLQIDNNDMDSLGNRPLVTIPPELDSWDASSGIPNNWTAWTTWNVMSSFPVSYETQMIDLNSPRTFTLDIDAAASPSPAITIDYSEDNYTWVYDQPHDSSVAITARWFKIRLVINDEVPLHQILECCFAVIQ